LNLNFNKPITTVQCSNEITITITRMWANAQLMVALPNIGSALCSTPQSLACAHCLIAVSRPNATEIRELKTWRMQSEFCIWQNSVTGQEPPKMYMWCTSPRDGQTPCTVWLASVERRRCSNEAKTQKPLKVAGVPQTNETISAASRPKFNIL